MNFNEQSIDGLNTIYCDELFVAGTLFTTGEGDTGDTGATGPIGEQGEKGNHGNNGSDGSRGDTGPAGADGSNGSNGDASAATASAAIAAISAGAAAASAGVAAASAASSAGAATASAASAASSAASAANSDANLALIQPKVQYQSSGISDVGGVNYTRFNSNVRISNGLLDNIVLYKSGNVDVLSTITCGILETSNVNIKANSYISFADTLYRIRGNRITISTGSEVLYSELFNCIGTTSNIQTQLNNITSNNIFNGIFSMATTFNGTSNTFNGNIIQTGDINQTGDIVSSGTVTSSNLNTTLLNIDAGGYFSFSTGYRFRGGKISLTTDGSEVLYSELFNCADSRSNLQNQIDNLPYI